MYGGINVVRWLSFSSMIFLFKVWVGFSSEIGSGQKIKWRLRCIFWLFKQDFSGRRAPPPFLGSMNYLWFYFGVPYFFLHSFKSLQFPVILDWTIFIISWIMLTHICLARNCSRPWLETNSIIFLPARIIVLNNSLMSFGRITTHSLIPAWNHTTAQHALAINLLSHQHFNAMMLPLSSSLPERDFKWSRVFMLM